MSAATMYIPLWTSLSVILLASNVSGRRGGLKIALHAQSKSSLHGWVAGSEITTRGLRRALLKRTDVSIVEIFAPFCYEGIANYQWDILLVEGFSGPVHSVIRGLRQFNKHVAVLHWCLDTYPALASVAAIDVDGFLHVEINQRVRYERPLTSTPSSRRRSQHRIDGVGRLN